MTTEKPDSEGEAAGREAALPRLLDKPDRIKLKRIKASRSSDMLAEKLREQILGGAYPPGSSRPNKRAPGCETPEYPRGAPWTANLEGSALGALTFAASIRFSGLKYVSVASLLQAAQPICTAPAKPLKAWHAGGDAACSPQPCAVDNMAGPSIAFGTFIEEKNARSARESCHERNRTRAGSSLR